MRTVTKPTRRTSARAGVLSVAGIAVLLVGCAAGDIEFEGAIFKAAGLTGAGAKKEEPELAPRAPLVVPPRLTRIPEPGQQPGSEAERVAALNDPDRVQSVSKEELERQHAEFCEENYEIPKARGDASADGVEGPLGPCRTSVLTAIQKMNSQ